MFLTTVLLGLAICAVWVPDLPTPFGRVRAWQPMLALTLTSAFLQQQIDVRGLGLVLITLLVADLSERLASRSWRPWLKVAAVALCFLLGISWLPGFQHLVFVPDTVISANATPMHLIVRLDAGIAGLVLLAFYARRIETPGELRPMLMPTLLIACITTTVVIGLGVLVGYVAFDLKAPSFTAGHLLKMLLWACVLEEAMFRGVIQESLMRIRFIASQPRLVWLPVVVPALLFGLMHASRGPLLVLLATLGGIGCGVAYAAFRRIEPAIFVHFSLNAVHFLAFTYPSLASGS